MYQQTLTRKAVSFFIVLLLVAAGCAKTKNQQGISQETKQRQESVSTEIPRVKTTKDSGLEHVPLESLPKEVTETIRVIKVGEPYPYERDGVIFQNREKILPLRAPNYYREFTVPTPGSKDRGARRIVIGKDGTAFYTEDHYDSFVQVDGIDDL